MDDPPEGLASIGLPDESLDGLAGIEGPREPAGHAPGALGLAGDEAFQKRPAGKAEGAQAVHDGLLEARGPGKFGVHVQREEVAREAIEQGLVGEGSASTVKSGARPGISTVREEPSSPPKPPSSRLKMLMVLV